MSGISKLFPEGDEDIKGSYEEVRADGNDTAWCAFKYEGKALVSAGTGNDYAEMLEVFEEDARIYAYVRFETGDEMSRRQKFAFITWIGPRVSPLKKAAVSTDKAFVKAAWPQFSKEILADELNELKYEKVLAILEKASGAAYGTGK